MAVPIPAVSPLRAITDTQYTKTAPQASVCGACLWLYRFCDDFTAHGHSLVRRHTEQPAQDTSDTRVNDLLALLSIGVDVMGKETPWDKDVVMKHIVPCEEVSGEMLYRYPNRAMPDGVGMVFRRPRPVWERQTLFFLIRQPVGASSV